MSFYDDFNHVMLIGHLGKKPEIKHNGNHSSFAVTSLATNKSYIDKKGNTHTYTDWHQLFLGNHLVPFAEKNLDKGSRVLITGELRTHDGQDKEGKKYHSAQVFVKELRVISQPEKVKTTSDSVSSENSNFPDDALMNMLFEMHQGDVVQ